jgi:hypothetical protein
LIGTFGGHSYFASNAGANFNTANTACVSAGGYLAAIGSAAENTFVRTYIDAQNYNAWIGYTDATTEGSFVWTNGEPNVYTNWETGW